MKRFVSSAILILLVVSIIFINKSELAPYTDKTFPLIRSNGSSETITLRFYKDQPNVPYFGLRHYSELLGLNPLTVSIENDGTYVFTNNLGAEAVADCKKEIITSNDWATFHTHTLSYEEMPASYRDTSCQFLKLSDIHYEGDAKPLVLNFQKYGLKMYAEEDDVYLSFSLISSILSEISTWHMLWNGERVYVTMLAFDDSVVDGYYDSDLMRSMIKEGVRPHDIAIESYNELCFIMDYFNGQSGAFPLSEALAEKGLNQALLDLGEEGKDLIDNLKSTKSCDYLLGMNILFFKYLYDGHTTPSSAMQLLLSEVPGVTSDDIYELQEITFIPILNTYYRSDQITETRNKIWGDTTYHEYKSTAIITFNEFLPDEEGWEKFYSGEADIPMDCIGIIVSGLKKASQNPEIRNIIFDLSTNGGGSSDLLAFIKILTTGNGTLYGLDKNTGQKIIFTFEADTNLDGIIDDQDKYAIYDQFNYGVLTASNTFSCGNLFPITMQEEGAVLIGEPTGGGSCCVQLCVCPDGLEYMMSSSQWQLTDNNFISVESGCKTDLPIEHLESHMEIEGFEGTQFDYSSYFDDEKLNEMMNEWFMAEEEKPAA